MRQTWRDLTFLHWPYEPAVVRPLVPDALELDLWGGAAWIGLVPFLITDLTLPRAPAIPWLSRFPETNVRTYVIDKHGRRGVWFFSLDAARWPAVVGARMAYGLPYFHARMEVVRAVDEVRYSSRRLRGPAARSEIHVGIAEPVREPNEQEVFLTARFRLYAPLRGRLIHADVRHQPWPLHRVSQAAVRETLVQAAGLPPPSGTPLAHFAPRVHVLVAKPAPV